MVLTEQLGPLLYERKKMKVPANINKIWKRAIRARLRSYSPYSKFRVGAAFQAGSEVVSGCNIENASYGATLCAERVAIFKAVSEGRSLIKDMVVVADTKDPTPPCGLCLQVMTEFCPPDLNIWMATSKKVFRKVLLSDLLRIPFSRTNLLSKSKSK
ncbi:MAG: cytidine deaminase [Bacteriovoracaceae bacterium]|nr:cytidine deaminase [Bacteriovoracaceae bacterium]